MASLIALPSSNLSSAAGTQVEKGVLPPLFPGGFHQEETPSRDPAQAPPALPLTLMGTSSGEQPQDRHEDSSQHPGPQRSTSTPPGALGRLCPASPPCTGGVGVQPSADRLHPSAAAGEGVRQCLPEFPCINILSAPHQGQPWLSLCSPPSALSTHGPQP